MKFDFKEQLLRSTVMTGIAATAAMATAPVAMAQDGEGVEEIFVTGSRIARKDFTANSPVVTVGQEELDLSGVTNIENLLNQLPAVVPGLSSTSNNPGNAGSATVDLRGLGVARTLVLVNGRRLAPGEKSGVVDLNTIPSTLVERVEVVTGGASAVYGSDALAGVVNFILKDDFEGAELGVSYGQSDREDAIERTYDVTIGGNFADGRGNAVLYGQIHSRDGVLQGERPFGTHSGPTFLGGTAAWGSSRPPASTAENSILNGFGTDVTVINPNTGNPFTDDGTILGDPQSGRWSVSDDGTTITFGTNRYNFAPVNALLLPQERTTLSGLTTYEINDYVNAFLDFHYSDVKTNVQLAPAPLTPTNGITVPVTYPFIAGVSGLAELLDSRLADPTADYSFQRRMKEIGNRLQFHDKEFYQYVTGLNGNLPDWPLFGGWDYEVSYQAASASQYDRLENDLSATRVQESINGCPGSIPGCTQINIYGEDSITPAQADWLRLYAVIDQHTYDQEIVSGFISGDVWELPAGPLQMAIGAEYREDSISFIPANASRGDLIGFNGVQPSSGSADVKEGYVEAVIPILSDYEMAQYLGIEAGFRYSKYSSVGGVRSFKVGAEWQPVDDIRFRIMYQEATRAPSVFELFQAGDQNFPNFTDPCNGPVVGDIADICAWQLGLTLPADQPLVDAFSQSDSQVEEFRFGNPNLNEEQTETLTIGAVITPTSILPWGDLSVSVDYYDIQVSDWIGYRGVGKIIDECFSGTLVEAMASADCAAIPRNAAGDMQGIINPQENFSTLETSGIDLNAVYSFSMDEFGVEQIPGDFQVSVLASYLDSWVFDGTEYKGVAYGLGFVFPEWKSTMRATYSLNDWQVSWQLETIGEVCDLMCYSGLPVHELKNYSHVSARWFATDNVELTVNVDNLFDEQPQESLHGYFAGPNVDASVYDVMGRYYRMSARLKF